MAAQQKIHKSMRGKAVDMNKLMNQNEMTLAVGNARVNARGDEIGPGGKIISKSDNITAPGGMSIQMHQNKQPVIAELIAEPIAPTQKAVKEPVDTTPAGDA